MELSQLDPDMAAANAKMAELIDRDGGLPGSMVEDRAQQARLAPFWAEDAPEVESSRTLELPGAAGRLRARLHRPAGSAGKPLVLFLHGGGWARGSIDASEWHCRALAAWSGLPLLATSYRLAPEHPYPAPLDDVVAAWRWCSQAGPDSGFDPTRIILCGASAGANLALAATLRQRDEGGPPPIGLVSYFGVFGSDLETGSYTLFGDGRFGLSKARMRDFFDYYLPSGIARDHPYIAPIKGDLRGLPPNWLGYADLDVLRDDTILFEQKLRAAGVSTEIVLYKGLTHGFTSLARLVPRAFSF